MTQDGGYTPVIIAAFKDKPDCVRFLIAAGADLAAKGGGKTALEWAKEKGFAACIALLEDAAKARREEEQAAAKAAAAEKAEREARAKAEREKAAAAKAAAAAAEREARAKAERGEVGEWLLANGFDESHVPKFRGARAPFP